VAELGLALVLNALVCCMREAAPVVVPDAIVVELCLCIIACFFATHFGHSCALLSSKNGQVQDLPPLHPPEWKPEVCCCMVKLRAGVVPFGDQGRADGLLRGWVVEILRRRPAPAAAEN
jgi:hypothetical protein